MKALYHDGALCPECAEMTGTPSVMEGRDPGAIHVGDDVRLMRCPACGEEWREEDTNEVARAWFALGAYEQSQRGQESVRVSTMKYIVQLSDQAECYASEGLCQRTTLRESAMRFASMKAAQARLRLERKHRSWPTARVIEVPA